MARFKSSPGRLRTFKASKRPLPEGLHCLLIEHLAEDGRGVSRVDGKTVFVRGALAGEQVKARYLATHKNYDEALTQAVINPSPARVTPPCEYADRCGGCNLQHLQYSAQLDHKQQQLQRLFAPLLANNSTAFEAPLQSLPSAYRHRARLAVAANRSGCRVGFRQNNSHQIVDIEHCAVLFPSLSRQIPALKALLSSLKNRAWLTALSLTEDSDGKQGIKLDCKQMLAVVDLQRLDDYARHQGIGISLQLMGVESDEPLWQSGDQRLQYTLDKWSIALPFSMTDFTQINPAVNRQLIAKTLDWLQLTATDTVADYFCGIGNFSLPMARSAASVIGFELVQSMVHKARHNAAVNAVENAEFVLRDLMGAVQPAPNGVNKVVLDPPRAGAEQLCRQLVHAGVERIVYISCNPKTLLRDAQHLLAGPYRLEKIALADMFPHTRHSEAIALFTCTAKAE